MSELKRCPFCGGEAEIHSVCSWQETGGDEMFFAMCGKCLTKTRYFGTEKSVILTWNTRKPMQNIVKQLEALKMRYFLTIANTGNEKLDFAYEKAGNAIDKATEIVKEEGGLNE